MPGPHHAPNAKQDAFVHSEWIVVCCATASTRAMPRMVCVCVGTRKRDVQPEKNEIFNIFLFALFVCLVNADDDIVRKTTSRVCIWQTENARRTLFFLFWVLFPIAFRFLPIFSLKIARMAIHLGERRETVALRRRQRPRHFSFTIRIILLPFVQQLQLYPLPSHSYGRQRDGATECVSN